MRVLLGLIFLVGCSDIKSSALSTSGMHVEYTVATQEGAEESSVDVVLKAGGAFGSFVELDGGDQLVVTSGDESQVLEASSFLTLHSYQARLAEHGGGAVFTLRLERESMDSALSSTVTLPDPFQLTQPTDDTVISFSEQETFLIEWQENAADDMHIQVDGDCILSYSGWEEVDSGSHSVPIAELLDEDDPAYNGSAACNAVVTVERRREGTVDPAFETGVAMGIQRSSIDIRFEP